MPGHDRTGPMGEGPRTGRGLGRCNNHHTDAEHHHGHHEHHEHDEYPVRRRLRDGSCHAGHGRGRGLGRGHGRGLGRGLGRG